MMNMIIVTYASGAPAFMLNPYLFPEDNTLFVSHCTSPRMHSFDNEKMDEMIIIRGNIVRNTAFPSCRTQMELQVEGDISEIAQQYQGRHWALVYGDQSEKIGNANRMPGIRTKLL